MKIPNHANPARLSSTDETRFVINHVKVEAGHMIATNGRALIVQQIEIEPEDQRHELLIHADTIRDAVKPSTFHRKRELTILNKGVSRTVETDGSIITYPEPQPMKFPEWAEVIPDIGERVAISLDTRYLRQISKAFGEMGMSPQVTLHLDVTNPMAEIFVTTARKDQVAILMPCRMSHDLSENNALSFAMDARAEVRAKRAEKEASKNGGGE